MEHFITDSSFCRRIDVGSPPTHATSRPATRPTRCDFACVPDYLSVPQRLKTAQGRPGQLQLRLARRRWPTRPRLWRIAATQATAIPIRLNSQDRISTSAMRIVGQILLPRRLSLPLAIAAAEPDNRHDGRVDRKQPQKMGGHIRLLLSDGLQYSRLSNS